MESFKGNGAECMVRFIKDGCKGSVCHRAPDGKGTAPVLVNRHIWEIAESAWAENYLGWLAMPCEYHPPEPVYRNATPGEALDAVLSGKRVEAKDKKDTPDAWFGLHETSPTWKVAKAYIFRIKED